MGSKQVAKYSLAAYTRGASYAKILCYQYVRCTMYNRDMPVMAKHGLSSPDGLVDIVTFVLCTIQQPLQQVGNQIVDIRANGADSKYLFGAKRNGYQFILDNKNTIYDGILECKKHNDVIGVVELLTTIPSLGMVKAGFVAQCLGFNVACIDSHNLDRLGMARSALRLAKGIKPELKRKKIADYVAFCQEKGAKYWWDTWCNYVADKGTNKRLKTGDEVSAYHVAALAI